MAKRELKIAIQVSKARTYEELLEDLDNNPWGKAYKMVTRSNHKVQLKEEEAIEQAKELIPQVPTTYWGPRTAESDVVPFTAEELEWAVDKIRNGKAAGPDGIPSEAARIMLRTKSTECLEMYNTCLSKQIFPTRWKLAELILLPKPGSNKFRPICLLDHFGSKQTSSENDAVGHTIRFPSRTIHY